MNNNEILVAVDLGSTHMAAIAAIEQPDGTLKIMALEEQGKTQILNNIRKGIIENSSQVSFKLNEMKQFLRNRTHSEINTMFVALGAKGMKMVEATVEHEFDVLTSISQHTIDTMIAECKMEIEQQNPEFSVFDIIPISYTIDGQRKLTDISKAKAKHISAQYVVVVGILAIKRGIDGSFDRSGIVLEHSALKMYAQSTAVLSDEARQNGAVIIDLGGETTTMSAFHDGRLQDLCVVPLGAHNITRDIASLEISEEYAEKLKLRKGCAIEKMVTNPVCVKIQNIVSGQPHVEISTQQLAEIIEARLLEILTPIFRKIKQLPFDLENGIVLTGGGAMLEGICEFVEMYTKFPVTIGSHAEWLADGTDAKYESPNYSQLIGLLALGAQYRKENIEQPIVKEPKIKKGLFGRLGDGVMSLFSDEENNN